MRWQRVWGHCKLGNLDVRPSRVNSAKDAKSHKLRPPPAPTVPRRGSSAASDTRAQLQPNITNCSRWAKLEPTGPSLAKVRPKLGRSSSWLVFGQTWGQGRPSLTPVAFGSAKLARFLPLCPIPWVRAVLGAKRLEYIETQCLIYT